MYAVVDIETTGGSAYTSGITEIAIIIFDGKHEQGRYHTLINPLRNIPHYITALTGINNQMVNEAPLFETVAPQIYNLLHDKIFVAHNVNFDYSFIKHHLQLHGFEINCRKLCTIRAARKVLPGYASYSLGNICKDVGIKVYDRHRATGDAAATCTLLQLIINSDDKSYLKQMLKGRNCEQYLPPHLPAQCISSLPSQPGVYYFHDNKGKIIYVGKATDLKKRVKSHFSNNEGSRRKQDLLRKVYNITHKICSSELMALVTESIEIRTLWPEFNRSQKKYHHAYGLYTYEDRLGYLRVVIEKKKKQLEPLYTFNLLHEGQALLRKMVQEFALQEAFIFSGVQHELTKESPEVHNNKLQKALAHFTSTLPTFAVVDGDNNANCLLMEKGRFIGYGNIDNNQTTLTLPHLRQKITPQPDNDYIRGLIYQYASRYPQRKITFSSI
jgi:DNA polymerase III subunit epsilon